MLRKPSVSLLIGLVKNQVDQIESKKQKEIKLVKPMEMQKRESLAFRKNNVTLLMDCNRPRKQGRRKVNILNNRKPGIIA